MLKEIFWFLILLYGHGIYAQDKIQHYVFFNIDRERIDEASFLEEDTFDGAQLKYSWRELEKDFDVYDFSAIRSDLEFLSRNGKKLFIQIQDVSFDTARLLVPEYLINDLRYNGGVSIQYITDEKDVIIRQDGYVSRRWDEEVRKRFRKLLLELGKQFDGKIEGMNLPETSIGFGETGKWYPEGFTPEIYKEAILEQMTSAKEAFTISKVIQYANFMPGEWLPWDNKGYLESIYAFASENDIGMGGPDVKIYKKAQMNHSYKFLKKYALEMITGMAVQWGNYEEINPKTGKQVSIEELYKFGMNELKLDYIFWCTQEPYYSKYLIPYLSTIDKDQ